MLTNRERQALALVGDGLTNGQIARRMHVAPSTAKEHISALLAKLGLRSRVQAAVLADRAGLLHTATTGRPPPRTGRADDGPDSRTDGLLP